MRWALRVFALGLALVFAACGGDTGGGGGSVDAGPATVCVPRATRSCPCLNGSTGLETCFGDGSGYDACLGCGTPSRCGDGACTGAETCSSCPGDCRCASACMGCAQNADCPSGYTCDLRRCDGARGCYSADDPSATCATIGGVSCPATAAYNVCTGDAECGPFAVCARFGDGRAVCSRRCTADTDCPTPPTGNTSVRRCNTTPGQRSCFLECTGPNTCPFGLSCFRYENGRYGYCS